VDAGFSGVQLARRLRHLGVQPESVEAVVVTHEHLDHTRGIGVGARRWGWRLLLTPGTRSACDGRLRGGERVELIRPESRFRVGDAEIHAFATCHDAAEPIAVTVRDPRSGLTLGVATDLGRATAPVRAALSGCHFLVLESNHDEDRLRASPYPWKVKQRIGGSRGHLSNRLAAELAAELLHPELGGILLAHLSQECNDPVLARREVAATLARQGWKGRLELVGQEAPSPWFAVAELARRADEAASGGQMHLFHRS
jgi:phosphoribosyl 1,2-cyclic phosphodiesterase